MNKENADLMLKELTDKLKELWQLIIDLNPKDYSDLRMIDCHPLEFMRESNYSENILLIEEKLKYPFLEKFKELSLYKEKDNYRMSQIASHKLIRCTKAFIKFYDVPNPIPSIYLNKNNLYLGNDKKYLNKMSTLEKINTLVYKDENETYDLHSAPSFVRLSQKYQYIFLEDDDFYDIDIDYREIGVSKQVLTGTLISQYNYAFKEDNEEIDLSKLYRYLDLYQYILLNYHLLTTGMSPQPKIKPLFYNMAYAFPIFFLQDNNWTIYPETKQEEENNLESYYKSTSTITIPLADLKNRVFFDKAEKNIGYLKIEKNLPLSINTINMNESNREWLQQHLNEFTTELELTMIQYSHSFDDLMFSKLLYEYEGRFNNEINITIEKNERQRNVQSLYNPYWNRYKDFIRMFLGELRWHHFDQFYLYLHITDPDALIKFCEHIFPLAEKYGDIFSKLGEDTKKDIEENLYFRCSHVYYQLCEENPFNKEKNNLILKPKFHHFYTDRYK